MAGRSARRRGTAAPQPIARAIRPNWITRKVGPKVRTAIAALRQTRANSPISTAAIHSPTQIRTAIRPTRRLPAAIWADPGSSSVMPKKVKPRRNLIRSLRC